MAFQWRTKSQGRLMRQHIALVQQHDVIALLGFIEIGGAHQHGDILAAQQFDDAPEFTPRNGIDPDCGLIEQQQPRRAQQGAGQPQLLLHAAGKRPRAPMRKRAERGELEQLVETLLPLCGFQALQIGIEVEILLNGEVFIKTKALRHVADHLLNGRG
jgi:hypothetical protein